MQNNKQLSEQQIQQKIKKLEEIIQRDEGNRGIKALIIEGEDELFRASTQLMDAKNICIITGFQCLLDYEIKTETDGPLGAFVIAHALLNLQKNVQIISDAENEQVLTVAYKAYNQQFQQQFNNSNQLFKLTIIKTDEPLDTNEKILEYLIPNCDHILSIERCGPSVENNSQDRHYYTMKGRDMKLITAPLENFIFYAEKNNIKTTGIGDGGNECGMGKVIEKVKKNIFKGDLIGTYIKTDNLIVSSVSNWGGYALSVSITFLNSIQNQNYDIEQIIEKIILNEKYQGYLLQEMIKVGARDGTNYKQEMSVDGFSFEKNIEIFKELINCLKI